MLTYLCVECSLDTPRLRPTRHLPEEPRPNTVRSASFAYKAREGNRDLNIEFGGGFCIGLRTVNCARTHEAASSGQLGTKTVHFLDSDVIRQGSSLGGSGQFSTKIGFLTVCGQTYRRIETESSWLATLSRPRTLLFNVAEPHGPFFSSHFVQKRSILI